MRLIVATTLASSMSLACTAAGPSLGPVRDVKITETGSYPGRPPTDCRWFTFSTDQIRSLLQRSLIITGMEKHSSYFDGTCFVRGTATFDGRPAKWEFDEGGTGTVALWEEAEFTFADPKQRVDGR